MASKDGLILIATTKESFFISRDGCIGTNPAKGSLVDVPDSWPTYDISSVRRPPQAMLPRKSAVEFLKSALRILDWKINRPQAGANQIDGCPIQSFTALADLELVQLERQ